MNEIVVSNSFWFLKGICEGGVIMFLKYFFGYGFVFGLVYWFGNLNLILFIFCGDIVSF